MLFDLVATSRGLRAAPGRLDKIDRLAAFLARTAPPDIEIAVAYLCGALPQGRIGVGFAAVRDACAAPPAPAPGLSLADVDAALTRVAGLSGPGSTAGRVAGLRDLFGSATPDEQDFLAHLLCGEIRHGALASIMSDAVAKAARLPAARVRRAVMLAGGLGPVARAALTGGAQSLEQFALRVFHPVQPMLAQSAASVDEARSRLGDLALDGARIQVHKEGTAVRVLTRHLREVTGAVPEVVERDGQVDDGRLRGGRSGRRLVEDQAGGDTRPRGAGGRMGWRTAAGLVEQPPPRRTRRGGRRLRHARQDLQGADRRDTPRWTPKSGH